MSNAPISARPDNRTDPLLEAIAAHEKSAAFPHHENARNGPLLSICFWLPELRGNRLKAVDIT